MARNVDNKQSGELTLKQAGIMLVVIAAIIVGANVATASRWEWGGVPVEYIAGAFGALGIVLAIVGFAKKI